MRARLGEVARRERDARRVVPALACYGVDTALAVLEAAADARRAVTLLVPPARAAEPTGAAMIRALRVLADEAPVPVSVQLDHAVDVELIGEALAAGADAVLADGSALPFEENIAFVRQVRRRWPDAVVEAELGAVRGDEDVAAAGSADERGLTDPELVAEFTERSGADLLACAVGNVHGSYAGAPHLDWDRVRRIRRQTDLPLVLHGASGLPMEDLARAGGEGFGKINVNTELRQTQFAALGATLGEAHSGGANMLSLHRAVHEATRKFCMELFSVLS